MATTGKTLRRLPKQGQIAGVCAGLAEYFDIDVTLMRVIFVILAFASGGGMVIAYLILAIVLPVDKEDDTISEKIDTLGKELQDNRHVGYVRNFFGIGLLILGAWLLLVQFFPEWLSFRWDYVWPIVLIFAGILILTKRR